ncbi:MAG: hypothetical protein ACRC8S_02105 [Fimbriiglobus sp.]
MNAMTLRFAAYFRAQGHSWEQISKKLNIPVDTLELLPALETAEWDQHMEEFAAQIIREAMIEAVISLRSQVKSANEKIRQTASLALTKYQMEQKKLAAKREALLAQEAKLKAKAKKPIPEEPIPVTPPVAIPVEETITIDVEAEFQAFQAANPFPKNPPATKPGTKKLESFLG